MGASTSPDAAARKPAATQRRSYLPHAEAEYTRSLLHDSELFPLESTARQLDWNLLRSFIVIVQERSLTRAANRLLVTQPSVSNALRRLEEQLGTTLIKRGGSRFELTPAGLLLFEESLEIYGHVSRLSSRMADLGSAVQGTVRLSMASTMPDHLLSDLLYSFHQDFPDILIESTITSSINAERSVLNKTSTLALVYLERPRNDLSYEPVYQVRFGHFCGRRHSLYGCSGLTVDDLVGEDFVSLQTNRLAENGWPGELLQMRHRIQARTVAQSFNIVEVRRLVAAGLGIGMLPLHSVEEDERAGDLWRLPPYEAFPEAAIFLVTNPRCSHTLAEQLFIGAIRERVASFTPRERALPHEPA